MNTKKKPCTASRARFSLGRVVATPGALRAFDKAGQGPLELLRRHMSGDWGELCSQDREANELAVDQMTRILSAYRLPDGVKIWVITEADRSSTCLLLPEEY